MKHKSAALVTVATVCNILVTSVNQVLLAFSFGAGTSMDAFLACGAVPFVILNLAIGDLSYILVPLLMRYSSPAKQKAAIDACFSFVFLLALAVTASGIFAHRVILRFTTSNMPATTFELAASLAPYMWVIMGLTIIGSYLTGLHHHYRSFVVPSSTLALPYLGMIAGGLSTVRSPMIYAVVLGWMGGTLIRDALLYTTLRHGAPRFSLYVRHPATRLLMKRLAPLGISLLPFVALPLIDVFWASRLPTGSISFLGYGTRIVIALTSLVVQGASVVLFPDLAADAENERFAAMGKKAARAMTVIFAIFVPLAFLTFLIRVPLLALLLQHGRFTLAASRGVAGILPYFLFGAVWMSMMNIVSRSFYALQDYGTPAKSGLLALLAYTIASGILIVRYSYYGIAMAYAGFWLLLFLFQTSLLSRKTGNVLGLPFVSSMIRVVLCTGLSGIPALAIDRCYPSHGNGLDAAKALIFLLVYYLTATYLFSIHDYRDLLTRLAEPLWRGRSPVVQH